jgi:hypothetical protein
MLIASQLSRSGRLIRRYFFFFFGFFFSFRMPVPFATGSPPLVNDLSVIIDTEATGANQFLHVELIDLGVFQRGERPELIDGLLLVREAPGAAARGDRSTPRKRSGPDAREATRRLERR